MLLSTIGDEIGYGIDEQINIVKECNIKYMEIRKINNKYLWEYSLAEISEFKSQFKKEKIEIICLDTPIGKKHNANNLLSNINLLKKYIKISEILENKYLRIFSDIGEVNSLESIKKTLTQFLAYLEGTDLELLIENEKDTFADTISIAYQIANSERKVGLLFDVENENHKGLNVIEQYKKYKSHIKYIHLRDYNNEKKEFVLIGKGSLKINELINMLKKDNYNGIISLETMLPKYNKNVSKEELFFKSYNEYKNMLKEDVYDIL